MDLIVVSKLTATDWKEALTKLCAYAVKEGYAKKTLIDAMLDREKRCPTGLPVDGHRGVALPHEDVVHAEKPLIMIARPVIPLLFGRMDNAEEEIEALLIIMVIVDDVKKYLNTIEKLTPLLKNIKLVEKMRKINLPELKQEMLSNLGEEFATFEVVEFS
ncbi:MAG: PTS sugar transporter subunit IIA [Candidatus Bathyarchaeota archaeon]|nr:PTS sugar transporter subunit IIA [Candidatus Bathyarchaeota archaeon]